MSENCGLCKKVMVTQRVQLRGSCNHRFHDHCLDSFMMGVRNYLPLEDGSVEWEFAIECPECNEEFEDFVYLRDGPSNEIMNETELEEMKKSKKEMQAGRKEIDMKRALLIMEVRESAVVNSVLKEMEKKGDMKEEEIQKQVAAALKRALVEQAKKGFYDMV